MTIRSILVANRGEIARRVFRTARELGIATVAVHSDADARAPFVREADRAVHLPGNAPADTYLRGDLVIAAAKSAGASAIHPGYGFLSENADFARDVEAAGLTWIGPKPETITAMGSKIEAKKLMKAAGVPILEVDPDNVADTDFPLLVKASAGGGGRGMRVVEQAADLQGELDKASAEAASAFGDGTVFVEPYLPTARHVEVQVLADTHGTVWILGDRDCSIQRRHQKVVEEAPAPGLSEGTRKTLHDAARAAAQAVSYVGAGTVEFLVQDEKVFFLEMNTRLQVEHPVTEMISGLDLVEWQLRVASGQPLPLKQEEIRLSGHAIEARLYTEDPYADFAPQTGAIRWWRPARALYDGVRIDDGIREGGEVTPFYDPMVAKLIVHGRDRDDAIRRLIATLDDAPLLGLKNNGRFLRDLVDHADFRAGAMTTALIDRWLENHDAILQRPEAPQEAWQLAAALFALKGRETARATPLRSFSVTGYGLHLSCDGVQQRLQVEPRATAASPGQVDVHWSDARDLPTLRIIGHDLGPTSPPGHALPAPSHTTGAAASRGGDLRYELGGVRKRCLAVWVDDALHLVLQAATFVFTEVSPWPARDSANDPRRAVSPVAGVVAQVLVKEGDAVLEGQMLVSVEAMKMEMWLSAQAAGVVKAVHVSVGEQVQSQALLLELDLPNTDSKDA